VDNTQLDLDAAGHSIKSGSTIRVTAITAVHGMVIVAFRNKEEVAMGIMPGVPRGPLLTKTPVQSAQMERYGWLTCGHKNHEWAKETTRCRAEPQGCDPCTIGVEPRREVLRDGVFWSGSFITELCGSDAADRASSIEKGQCRNSAQQKGWRS
jgi:hypothetical protein